MLALRINRPGDKPLLIIGMDKRNVERMKTGRPMYVPPETLGLNAAIAVCYGDRLEDIVNELGKTGLDVPAEALDAARRVDST